MKNLAFFFILTARKSENLVHFCKKKWVALQNFEPSDLAILLYLPICLKYQYFLTVCNDKDLDPRFHLKYLSKGNLALRRPSFFAFASDNCSQEPAST